MSQHSDFFPADALEVAPAFTLDDLDEEKIRLLARRVEVETRRAQIEHDLIHTLPYPVYRRLRDERRDLGLECTRLQARLTEITFQRRKLHDGKGQPVESRSAGTSFEGKALFELLLRIAKVSEVIVFDDIGAGSEEQAVDDLEDLLCRLDKLKPSWRGPS